MMKSPFVHLRRRLWQLPGLDRMIREVRLLDVRMRRADEECCSLPWRSSQRPGCIRKVPRMSTAPFKLTSLLVGCWGESVGQLGGVRRLRDDGSADR